MRRAFILLSILIIFSGCSRPVEFNVSDDYLTVDPVSVAVLPVFTLEAWAVEVGGDASGERVKRLFRSMAGKQLAGRGYRVVDFSEVDDAIERWSAAEEMAPGDVARALGVDAAMVIEVLKWKEKRGVLGASLKIKARFSLYDPESLPLWDGEYETKESELTLDKEAVEASVIKAYEPRIERVVEAVLSTIPARRGKATDEERWFEWLP